MDIFFGTLDILGVILATIFCVAMVLEKSSQNQKYLLLTFVCGLVVSVGDVLEFFATSMEAALVAVKVAYIGKAFIIIFAFLFSFGFNRIDYSVKIIRVLGIVNVALVTAIMTCQYHTLFYKSIEWTVLPSGRGYLLLEHGLFYYLWTLEFAIAVLWYCMHAVLVWRKYPNISRETKARVTLLIIAVFAPCFFMFASFLSPIFTIFDWTTVAIVTMEGFMLIAVKKYGLLDTMQLAQERILEDTNDGIIVVDSSKTKILFVNTQARVLFPELTTGQQKEVLSSIFDKDENVVQEKGRHYELRISEIIDKYGSNSVQGYVPWIFDMAFIDTYATEMIRLRDEAERANQAKTSFLAHMSHEIRTPMNAIVGFSELALRVKDEKMLHDYMKNIRVSAGNLLQLINEILDISKIEAGKMELVNVKYNITELVQELYSMVCQAAKTKDLELNFQIEPDVPDELIGDRSKITEILLNLVNNAIKYTNKGSVSVRISLRERTANHVRLHLEVEDTGIGIKKENQESIFKVFEQVDTEKNYGTEGTGLGLTIVKSLVEMMNGNIRVESEYGKGTVFFVEIRQRIEAFTEILEPEPQAVTPQTSREDVTGEPRSAHVMVVDDNELNCDVAQGILECLDMEVTVASSGAECLEKLKYNEDISLVFMDHMMPEMDGVETLHHVRELGGKFATLPVVLLTANAVSGVREQMMEEGFDEFLSKPIDIDELRRILLHFLGKK